jgi:hypothetical protein
MSYSYQEGCLIASNFAMLPTIGYTMYRMKKDKRPYFLELITFFVTMCVSAIYHFYDNNQASREVFWELYRWDRIMAFQTVSACMIHVLDVTNYFLKFLVWSLSFAIHIITQYEYNPYSDNILGLCLTIGINLSFIAFKYRLHKKSGWVVFLDKNDMFDLAFTMGYIITGLTLFILSNTTYTQDYWWMHSLWHVCIFLSTWSALDMRETEVSFFCIPRKKALLKNNI